MEINGSFKRENKYISVFYNAVFIKNAYNGDVSFIICRKYQVVRYAGTTIIQNYNRYIDNVTFIFSLQKTERQKPA